MEKYRNTILLADDDHDDLNLLTEVLNEIDPSFTVIQTPNGEEALAMLEKMKHEGMLPCLIVLDINMPKLDGKQTLTNIQKDEVLTPIPVVIFSTSQSEVDKSFFMNRNVEMITKPVELEILYKVAVKMLQYCRT